MSGTGRRWWLVIALLLSVGVNAGILSILAVQRLQGPKGGKRPAAGATPFAKAADRLHLQGPERQRFLVIHRAFFAEHDRVQMRVGALRRQLRRQLSARRPDEERIERIVADLGTSYAQLDRLVAKTVLESRAILNPRQERAYLKLFSRLRAAAARHSGDPERTRRQPKQRP